VVPLVLFMALAGLPQQAAEGDRPREAARLMDLAKDEISRGDYPDAMRHAKEAADLYAAVADRGRQADALNRLGRAALYAGQYGEAAVSFQSAVDLSSAVEDTDGQAEQLGNLGSVHFFVGRYSDAARVYDAALAVVAKEPAASWAARRRRILLGNKGALFQRLGREQEALAIYHELSGQSELPLDEQAQLLVSRGSLYRRLGDPVKALAMYEEARHLFSKERHVTGELGAMRNRGIVLALDLQQLDAAERAFSDVLELAEIAGNRRELLHARLYRGETRLRAGQPEKASEDFAAGLALARELRTPEEEWKALYGLGRSVPRQEAARDYLAQAITVIEQIRERIRVPSLRADFFNDKTEVYDAVIAARLGDASPDETFTLIERSHSRAWRERLGLSGPIELSSLRQALPRGTLLLDYWSSPRGSILVAATRTRASVLPVTVDDTQVKTLIDAVASSELPDWRTASQTLSSQVMPPSDWFDGVEHVVVVTAGSLTLVPFELLIAGDRLLIERAAISYAPTAATLLRPSLSTPRWLPPWQFQLRAFGDPVFTKAALDDAMPGRTPLTSSATEIRTIASELAGTSALHLAADNLKAHVLGPNQPPILHIASHASASTVSIEQSRILFSSATASESSADYLYLREAYDLSLGNVELAVLSACDTERGPLVRGEGVQSFSRAFLAAGARSTVTTLWRVADAPTANLMQVFYHHLQRGESRDEALRLAKIRFLQSGSTFAHPHYWAAFVLTGDGLRPVPRAISWMWVGAASILAILMLTAGGWTILRRRSAVPLEGH
jgi:CHAT domain-containing protein/tetratricopeptide (TPR) repeat protein